MSVSPAALRAFVLLVVAGACAPGFAANSTLEARRGAGFTPAERRRGLGGAQRSAPPYDDEAPVLQHGAALEDKGDFDQAKAAYAEGLRKFPRSGELHLRLGTIALRERRWEEAIRYLDRARAVRPRHVDTLYYLAQAYYLDGQHAAARETIGRAAALAPNRPEVLQKHGEYLCEANLCKDGLRHLQKAQRLDPTLPNIDFDLGMAYHKQTELPDARRHLEAALKLDPANLVAARFLADVLGREDHWDKAKDLYELVAAREPRNAWAHYGVGRSLIALGQPEAALRPLQDAVRADPTIAEAHFQLGQALRQLGRRHESQAELDLFRLLRGRVRSGIAPVKSDRTPFEARVWDACARLVQEGKEAEAHAYLDSLSKADGPAADYLLGVLYFNLDRGADAVRLLTRAAAASPADADVLAFLGRAYVSGGEYERAEEMLAKAKAIAPDGELPLIGAGELEYARARWEQAILAFEASKTVQVPALLKLCRAYARTQNEAKARETAVLVRAFGREDPVALRELDSILTADGTLRDP